MTDISIIGTAGGAVLVLITLDVVAGILSAASRGDISSRKLREGLMHKLALVLAFALAVALEWCEASIPIGLSIPLIMPVASYIIVMEACSIYENVRSVNPDFRFEGFDELFRIRTGSKEEGDDNKNDIHRGEH